ncbi:TIGR03752 family integrating conjugative element protein [Yersinia enterocolitica]|uniref:TIGR03752 family integrating conjugative element protein n=1 Tax=Yersinia enterocolitica TaxID=630 RepID=UPI0002F73F1A|nr:TIGR03752 family integrating conjugative element protein [Yersinia enterocolitica]AJJ23513.1 putative exported protein [Yersinia enterocolitica]CRY25265.1 integrating conjugative element protein%2C PFL_4705 family [Yersinia enterocolitica]HDL8281371.1 TIGR03752 family integrating conjugative element protein [Yersinia enterocolitica]
MKIKSNALVKFLVPLVILGSVLIGVKTYSTGGEKSTELVNASNVLADLTPDDLKAMGIEGDTPQDTLRTLVGSLKTVTTRQNQLDADNKALADESKILKQADQNIDERINQAIAAYQVDANKDQGQLKGQVQEMTIQIGDLMQKLKDNGLAAEHIATDIPVGLGLAGGGNAVSVLDNDSLQWIENLQWSEPQDGVAIDVTGKPVGESNHDIASRNIANSFTFATSFLDDNAITRQKAELANQTNHRQTLNGEHVAQGSVEPVYTLPENSTLIGSRAMTALLGRVPIDGKVTDPYPFKILIGKENLTANGIDLPDIQGAIVSGSATGDWTLSCVRGSVTSITFVFTDGTVRTLPRHTEGHQNNNNSSIGWLSDENGIPCLSGERKSNAATWLPTLFALSASAAAGEVLAQSQNTAQTNANGGVTSTLTGDAGQAVMGKALSGGMQAAAEWVKGRYGQTFDAIYVPPGVKVAVHITRQLAIDYEEKGRKVKHDFRLNQTETGMD